ncbi:MAG: 3-oxoacyl-ACP synthase III [Halobacteriovoraceae bacterium]|nr:3-oxoacyl-ACP synthase III [Halobacteriovoraceae bacterium]|tara:strand:- start:84300 stop:85319 length:1020 start_codon:yes stop_codon:yes gene_type:complete
MKFKNVYIESMAYHRPDVFLSSEELEKKLSPVYERLRLPFGRLELSTGIKSRGYFENLRPSGISIAAGKKALSQSKISKENIDLLIHSSVCRDFLEPSTASVVHAGLELKSGCSSFDLSNACLGFLDAMKVAAAQIDSGLINNALIVTGENSRPLIEKTIEFLNGNKGLTRKSIKKYFANLTIGSAGVAFVMTSNPENAIGRFVGVENLSDTSASELCQGDGNTNELMMETDSEELLKAGIDLAKNCFQKFKDNILSDIDHVVGHQVGVAHRNLLMKTLEIESIRDHVCYDRFGNTGSAACPLTMALAFENNQIKSGEKVAMLGIGSGLHTNMAGVQWL